MRFHSGKDAATSAAAARWMIALFLGLLGIAAVVASPRPHSDDLNNPEPKYADFLDDIIDEQLMMNRICFAMNARNDIPGGDDAFVSVSYIPPSRGAAALAIYNLLDQPFLGGKLPPPDNFGYLCTDDGVSEGMCPEPGLILFKNETVRRPRQAEIYSHVVHFSKVQLPHTERYNVTVSGIYCIIGMPLAENLFADSLAEANIMYVNAHGLLPAVDYPKLPFYGVTCLVYLSVLLLWMGKSALHWKEILPVQKYISGVVAFLVVETAVNYFYWRNWNASGDPSWPLLLLSAILNSGRNSVSLFILLIVALGYGVVKPSLGDDMKRCKGLAAVHLVFGALYAGFTLKQSGEHKGFAILLVVIPLSITLTLFYVWTLSALTATTQHLELRRQHYKLRMYKALWRLLFFAGLNLIAYFIVNSIWFAKREDVVFMAKWWRWRWFVADGWLNVLYSVCMLVICALWRPTSNNARYGLEELVSDPLEDEFELDVPDMFDGDRFGGGGTTTKRFGGPDGPHRDSQDGGVPGDGEVVFALESDDESEIGGGPSSAAAGAAGASGSRSRSSASPVRIDLRSRSPSRSPRRGTRPQNQDLL